jgi:hypothetical protein
VRLEVDAWTGDHVDVETLDHPGPEDVDATSTLRTSAATPS